MANDLPLLAWATLIAGIAFCVYMIIHRRVARNSDQRLKEHLADPENEWIDKEDLDCCLQAALYVEVDAEGNYYLAQDPSLLTDSDECFAFRGRVANLQQVIEARLGRIPSRIFFDKAAWQRVKEDRARWQDAAHFCRKVQVTLGPGIQRQTTVDN